MAVNDLVARLREEARYMQEETVQYDLTMPPLLREAADALEAAEAALADGDRLRDETYRAELATAEARAAAAESEAKLWRIAADEQHKALEAAERVLEAARYYVTAEDEFFRGEREQDHYSTDWIRSALATYDKIATNLTPIPPTGGA